MELSTPEELGEQVNLLGRSADPCGARLGVRRFVS
jgi:hypothetical protein